MCVDLKDIFNIVQLDKSDIKLFNKNAPIPEDTLNIVKKFQLMKIKASRESATENAIPDPDEVEVNITHLDIYQRQFLNLYIF